MNINYVLTYRNEISEASTTYSLPPEIIGAILWAESRAGLILTPPGPAGTGDHGHGRGLMQIDDRYHQDFTDSESWKDPRLNILYGAWVLAECVRELGDMKSAVCAYNAGPARVRHCMENDLDPNSVTFSGHYGNDVFGFAEEIAPLFY